MPSSTSSSDPKFAAPRPVERRVPSLGGAGWLALVLFVAAMAGWEAWARSLGVPSGDYRNSDSNWAETRRRIDNGEADGWVFLGSSRVLFNMQVPVWEQLDGRAPVQLAMEGTSPMEPLEGLADDPDFTGNVICGVAPGLFFSGFAFRGSAFKRYESESPSQWFGHQVSKLAEPHLAFYDPDFALPMVIERQAWPEREGVPHELEVRKLATMGPNRATRLWARVEEDAEFQELARFIWVQGWTPMSEQSEERRQKVAENRDEQIERAVAAVEKLKAKGSTVIFVQMPYEGHYAISEPDRHPRDLSWDPLIERTGALGLHFEDHEEMQGYWLPEWSHMSRVEADRFTEAFYHLVQREMARQSQPGESL